MSTSSPEVEAVRREYEQSLSWRITRPLRALKRRARAAAGAASPTASTRYDSWLKHLHGPELDRIEAACAGGDRAAYAEFRDLDLDTWAMLLTREYDNYPNIRALLPEVPDPTLQELWNGASGVRLALQSATFYDRVRQRYRQHTGADLTDASVLDFGCGWGRLTRFFARDVAPGNLYGCDPVPDILEVCRQSRVPATLTQTEFLPEGAPFEAPMDLAFSFSVFTHISERAHEHCLNALHASLRPGGILVVTIRPPEYLRFCPLMHPVLRDLGDDVDARLSEPRYLFVPHEAEPSHFQYAGGEMTYGETVITLPYIRERWADRFELLNVDLLLGDLYQTMVTLRRR